jgi:autotransporter-associated beta strand protein/T5SS/PEP-CTERM-associated repeat protein
MSGVSALAAMLAAGGAQAQPANFFNGTNSDDWFDAGNWSQAQVPTALNPYPVYIFTGDAQIDGQAAGTHEFFLGYYNGQSATLLIENGGTLATSETSYLGFATNSSGSLTIRDDGSIWGATAAIILGYDGTGRLDVEAGAVVTTTGGLTLGFEENAEGFASVSGTGSQITANSSIVVGNSGDGTLVVGSGAGVTTTGNLTLGFGENAEGSASVSGAGSQITANQTTFVGNSGEGTLIVGSGSTFTTTRLQVGNTLSGTGTVRVAGDQALLVASQDVSLIFNESSLTLSEGATLRVNNGNGLITIDNRGSGPSALNIGAALSDTATAAGAVEALAVYFTDAGARLVFNHTDTAYDFTPDLWGTGDIRVQSGTTTITGDGSTYFDGETTVSDATLEVTGSLGGTILINSGGTLAGTGTVGNVTVADGGILAPGASPGTFTMASLVLNSGSVLDFELDTPGVVGSDINDFIFVTGDLTLDGTLNVEALPDFGNGLYTLIDYGNLVANNGLEVGTIPVGYTYDINAGAVGNAGVVTLTVSGGAAGDSQYWDGSGPFGNGVVNGGAGTWNADNTNWTNAAGDETDVWGGAFAIFGGAAAGMVTVEDPQTFTGMQFLIDGYEIVAGTDGELVTDTAVTNMRLGTGVTATIAAPITGSGGLVKQELGALTLSGNNSYEGGTDILGGIVRVESDTALGTGPVVVDGALSKLYFGWGVPGIDAGALTITNRNQGATHFQSDSSAGNATITSESGSWVAFFDNSTAGDATLISDGGITQFYNNAKAGNATITNISGNVNFFSDTSAGTAEITNNISGNVRFYGDSSAGTAVITNDGLLRFQESSTAGDAEISTDLTLVFANNSTAGNAKITNTRTLVFDGDSTAGNAEITNTDGLTFSGSSTVGTATIVNDGNLFFSQSADDSYAGGISGIGAVFKSGTGRMTLSGVNTYTGDTAVSGGILDIAGSLVSAVTVDSGGTLAGIGTIGGLTLNSGGTLAPGNSIGTMTVAGNATFNVGSTYVVELNDGGNAPGINNDLLAANTAVVNGGAIFHVVPENNTDTGTTYAPNTQYTIIQTAAPGSLTVNGAPTLTDGFAFLDFTGHGDGQFYYLSTGAVAESFCLPGASFNQCSTGEAVRDLGAGNIAFDAVAGMNEADANAAFNALSGEIHASGQHVIDQSFGLFSGLLLGQARVDLTGGVAGGQVFTAPLGYSATPRPASLPAGIMAADPPDLPVDAYASNRVAQAWLAPLGGHGTVKADGNAGELDRGTAGLAAGYETTVDLRRGQRLRRRRRSATCKSHATVDARLSKLDADGFNIGAYGGWADGPWSLAGTLAYAANHISTTRRIVFGGVDETAEADYWSHAIGFSGEAAYAPSISATARRSRPRHAGRRLVRPRRLHRDRRRRAQPHRRP